MADRTVDCKFKYYTEVVYLNTKTNKTKEITNECLRSFVIDHNYEVNNMPVIYCSFSLDKALVDNMILNVNDSLLIFTLYKYDDFTENKLKIECFREKFTYFLPKDINANEELDYNDTNEESAQDSTYVNLSIGLLCINHINNNKKNINMTAKNTTMYDCVKYSTNHMKNILIEPFNYNDAFDQLIIPSIDSVSKTLKFLNNYRVFYNTPYRYYIDFDCAYVISSSGKSIPKKNDKFNSIIINIKEALSTGANDPGITINKTKNNYQMDVSYLNATVYDNSIINKSKTEIKGITSSGSKLISLAGSNVSQYNTNKISSIRINNDNTNMIDNIIYDNNSSNVYITLNKSDLDTSAFSLNKRYSIHNIEKYQDNDGDYLLDRKREIYIREGDTFLMNMILNFRKIIN